MGANQHIERGLGVARWGIDPENHTGYSEQHQPDEYAMAVALVSFEEQYQALESAARGVSDYLAHVGAEETDEIHQLAARLWTVLNSNPAMRQDES